jgi:hypothetical protein
MLAWLTLMWCATSSRTARRGRSAQAPILRLARRCRALLGESSTGSLLVLTGSAVVYVSATDADFREETVGDISSGTIDLSTGNVFSDAPAANATYVFSNPPATGTAYGFTLKVTPSATVTLTWPASVDWPAGTAPTAPASGATSVFVFYTQDGGSIYYGFLAGGAMA